MRPNNDWNPSGLVSVKIFKNHQWNLFSQVQHLKNVFWRVSPQLPPGDLHQHPISNLFTPPSKHRRAQNFNPLPGEHWKLPVEACEEWVLALSFPTSQPQRRLHAQPGELHRQNDKHAAIWIPFDWEAYALLQLTFQHLLSCTRVVLEMCKNQLMFSAVFPPQC